ncbi:MAG: dynamin family protein [Bacillota bacterium]
MNIYGRSRDRVLFFNVLLDGKDDGRGNNGKKRSERGEEMLQDFNEKKQELTDKFMELMECSRAIDYSQVADRIEYEIKKLEESEFHLMVVGQFKRGKSTLINYLIGDTILPTGVIPITSIITKIKHGSMPSALVVFNGGESKDIPLDEVDLYVSEEKNPENTKDVKYLEIEYPSQNLKNGLVLIDTPGIGSIFRHNTEVAYGHLPEADAAVFIISSDPPISQLEIEFLKDVRKYIDKIFIVQNKIDYLEEEEVITTVEFSKSIIQDNIGMQAKIYPLSALNALKASKLGDQQRLEKSGIIKFEKDLNSFLMKEKGHVLLKSAQGRFKRIAADITDFIEFRISNLNSPVETLEGKLEEFKGYKKNLVTQEKETVQLVEIYIKYILDDIEEHIAGVVRDNHTRIIGEIEKAYENNTDLKPRDMAVLLNKTLEREIIIVYEDFNLKEKEYVKEEFDSLMDRFTKRLNETIEYINNISQQIFGINISQPLESVELVKKDMFYFKFGPTSLAMLLPSKTDMAKLLPRGIGNRIVLNELKSTVEEQLKNNGANLKWEYICKLRDSKFIFEGMFKERIYSLIDET